MSRLDKDVKGISVKKEDDFSEWYTDVVQKAELADYAPVKGFMVIRPNGYSIWETIQKEFDAVIKKKGVRNAYFPLLIPDSFFKKEATHAEGFSPELAYVRNTEDGEKLAIRPTSETIMYDSYSKWIRSWRDLPLMINQWCNVLRWEVKQTKPFLRTREFLWQEGHCVFENEKEAVGNMNDIANEYKKMIEGLLAIPVFRGRKSKRETFAGAKETQAVEAFMPDGKALQCGTSHNLGQGFAKVFGVKFRGRDEKDNFGWQTSWGFSTRLIGAIILLHGDDKGLVLPPKVANQKIVIVPIFNEKNRKEVLDKAEDVRKSLSRYGAFVDDRSEYSPGWKFNEWEMKGIPIRLEIGPKDIEKKQVVIVRRDNGNKNFVKNKDIAEFVKNELDGMQKDMFDKAKRLLDDSIDSASDLKELKEKIGKRKIVKVYMKDDKDVEEILKDKTGGATSRIMEDVKKSGKCVVSGENVNTIAWVARSY